MNVAFTGLIYIVINCGDEAREILDMLKVLEGRVASGIDETYDWVQQGLVDFESGFKTEFDKE